MTDLTLIIPAKKEKESLPKVLQNLKYLNHKIIVSLPKNDLETIKSVKDFNILIHEQIGKGYGNSITEGINKCSTKYFCIFNADGSFDYKDLEKMLIKCKNNDIVLIGNDRGELRIHIEEFNGVLQGITIVEGIWPNEYFLDNLGINTLVGSDSPEPAGGAVFHDVAIWIKKVN